MRAYLAGPMSNIPDFNYPLFRDTAARLRGMGIDVLDPSEKFGGRTDLPYEVYLKSSIVDVLVCDAVICLPGWETSKGAALERHIGEVLGYPIYSGICAAPKCNELISGERTKRAVFCSEACRVRAAYKPRGSK